MSVMDSEHTLRNGLRFRTRPGTSDFNTVNACAAEDEYELEQHLRHRDWLVFDIGAHIGGVAVWAASLGNRAVAVEPIPENCQLIKTNARLNGVTVHVENAALGDPPKLLLRYMWNGEGRPRQEDEVAKIHSFIGNTGLGNEGFPADKEIWIDTVTLTGLVEKYGNPDIIKTDCEGGEWQLFRDPAVHDVALIVGEWHDMAKGYIEDESGEWVETESGYRREQILDFIGDSHLVTFSGLTEGAGGFRAVLK
jgi:FkbM family methyltransferase